MPSGVKLCCSYAIKAEISVVPDEISMADNLYDYGTMNVRIMGAIKGNGAADINDVVKAGLALASYPRHSR